MQLAHLRQKFNGNKEIRKEISLTCDQAFLTHDCQIRSKEVKNNVLNKIKNSKTCRIDRESMERRRVVERKAAEKAEDLVYAGEGKNEFFHGEK